MLDRFSTILRITCIALAGLLIYQLVQFVARKDPLENLALAMTARARAEAMPAAPASNAPPTGSNASPSAATNAAASATDRAVAVRRAGGAPAPQQPPLDPAVQARVDRVTSSELFAAVVRPLPMALLGIGGTDAFIRTPNGQTGLMRVGDELGGLKLLRVGTNRVLIEHEQQQKELMLFSGFGGETLMPQGEKK